MNYWRLPLSIFFLSFGVVFGDAPHNKQAPQSVVKQPEGWSVDVGGSYTWMSLSTPPTYTGSTGGVLAKISYQVPDAFFGQARSFYNSCLGHPIGPLLQIANI